MVKLAAIIGGVLLMAGVAYASTRTLLEQTTGPTLGTTFQPPATSTLSQEDRSRENEVRGRANEPGEDLRGDEAEHADDPRCAGVAGTPTAADDDEVAEDRGGDDRRGPSSNSGPSDRSGQDDDHGGSSGRGGGDDD
jgi:hypothetical protein